MKIITDWVKVDNGIYKIDDDEINQIVMTKLQILYNIDLGVKGDMFLVLEHDTNECSFVLYIGRSDEFVYDVELIDCDDDLIKINI